MTEFHLSSKLLWAQVKNGEDRMFDLEQTTSFVSFFLSVH